MFDFIARVLAFFYDLPVVGGSYGLAIILLTAAVMVVLMPLTLKATRSTIKMQEVQPKLKALQKKHKDDKQTLNTEMMALYSENGINPVGGCLPMVAQLPVFLVLFQVLRGLSRRVSEAPFYSVVNQARDQVGVGPRQADLFSPSFLSHDSQMFTDLSNETEMGFGPLDLAAEALDVLRDDFLGGLPYVALILFVVGSSFYQQRQVSSRRGGSAVMNPQQEMLLKFLPLLSGIWSFVFPAGLVIYWATSNAFRIAQQGYITRAFYGEKDAAENDTTDWVDDDGDDSPPEDTEKDSGGPKGNGSGSNGTSGSKKKDRRPRADAGGADDDGDGDDHRPKASARSGRREKAERAGVAESGPDDRDAAWAARREAKARSQADRRKRSEDSSRVTPKGTKPANSKKKRKR